jgi:hypothetical protein
MRAKCSDCGQDTAPKPPRRGRWEWYIVRDDVWALPGMRDGYLCICCLELRLGRSLCATDFSSTPINDHHSLDTARLRSRKYARYQHRYRQVRW